MARVIVLRAFLLQGKRVESGATPVEVPDGLADLLVGANKARRAPIATANPVQPEALSTNSTAAGDPDKAPAGDPDKPASGDPGKAAGSKAPK